MSASPRPERYYPTLAQTGTQQAIDCLVENFAGSRRAEAFDALLRVEAPQIAGVLYTIAAGNPDLADRALTRYTACVAALDATPVRKYQLYRQALELNPSPKIAVGILRKLEGIREFPALVLAGPLSRRRGDGARRCGCRQDHRSEKRPPGSAATRYAPCSKRAATSTANGPRATPTPAMPSTS